MKKPKTKAQVRAEIESQIADYIRGGGQVSKHLQGESSRSLAMHPFKAQTLDKPSESRTPVQDAIAAIESRRKPQPKLKTVSRQKRPRKILIKDDFGQPLRWVWEE